MLPTLEHPNGLISKNFRQYFREYCNSTGIHGFKYFGEKRTLTEKIWWFIIFGLCLSGCLYFIVLVYIKWESSPVIVSFSTKETPIYSIPFPAVTICPETKSNRSLYTYSHMIKKYDRNESLTLEEYKKTSYMNLLCEFNLTEQFLKDDKVYKNFDNYFYAYNEFFSFLYNITPNPYEGFIQCKWMNKVYPCKDILQTIITDEGICYTFNMVQNSGLYNNNVLLPDLPFRFSNRNISQNFSWNMDDGYTKSDMDTYPKRGLSSGAKNALDIIISEKNDNIDHACKLSIQGYKVILHTPTRVPRLAQEYFRLPLNHVVVGAIQPVIISTSDTVKMFKPTKRNCYFATQNERPLQFFQQYTQRNCKLECLTNFTNYWCDCVNFFMPRQNGSNISICGSLSKDCMNEAEDVLQKRLQSHMFNATHKRNKTEINNWKIPDCDCLPLCSDLSYDMETSSSQWDWINILGAVRPIALDDKDKRSLSHLIIYFKNLQFVTSKRHELYGPTDFLGNFGGLLGLFTGFSILSIAEVMYFLTVRIICNIRLYGHWSGSEK